MTNARLVAEYNALVPYMEEHDLSFEGPLSRKEELLSEMNIRLTRYDYYEDYKDMKTTEIAAIVHDQVQKTIDEHLAE